MPRLLANDFGRYSFILELSRNLALSFEKVDHSYCADLVTTPEGNLDDGVGSSFALNPIHLTSSLDKYNFFKRRKQEREYGVKAAALLADRQPDILLSANTPLDAQAMLWKTARARGVARVFWLQDLIGLAAYRILRKKMPVLGHIVGLYYLALEKRLLRQSDRVIAISTSFEPQLKRMGVDSRRVCVEPNWSPLNEIVPCPKGNQWAKQRGYDDKFVFMYSGTLSLKHNPSLLLELARAFQEEAIVVVRSVGIGAEWLRGQVAEQGVANLIVEDYGSYGELSQVFGSADVLIALLEPDAAEYSVPSKVLAYMCAARPLLLSIPRSNDAAKLVAGEAIGRVCEPNDPEGFCKQARDLFRNSAERSQAGERARKTAETRFGIDDIANRFADVLQRLAEKSV